MSLTINLGMEDFKTLREGHRVYVDKTVFIQNLFAAGTDDDTNTTNNSEEMISGRFSGNINHPSETFWENTHPEYAQIFSGD